MTPPLLTALPQHGPICHTCQQGSLVHRKAFRMSGPVVFIGFLLLVPSIFGMLCGVFMLLITAGTGSQMGPQIERQTRTQLQRERVPEPIIAKVVASTPIEPAEMRTLTPQQTAAVQTAQASVTGGKIGAGAGVVLVGGISVAVIIGSFIGGLLGWLLVMRKRILQCLRCGAVTAAS